MLEIDIQVMHSDKFHVDIADLKRAVTTTLLHLDYEDAALTIVLSSDEEVARLNKHYRDVEGTTDILSFPAQEGDDLYDLPPELELEIDTYLGDLVIAYPFTVAQAARYSNPLENELRLLVVHGTLHLLGYDHDVEDRQEEMWRIQREVLTLLGDTSTNWERAYES